MNSLLKKVKSVTNKQSGLVKDALRKQLNAAVMEIHGLDGLNKEKPIENCEETTALCAVLEAMFLHGLKDSLLNRVTEVLTGPDFNVMPQPSFWGALLVFSHRQIIEQVQGLKQIKTEVGFSRAWIRLALNDGLLSSYFDIMYRESSVLKPYYNHRAFIRDSDHMEIAKRLIESLDIIYFNLACNSSLLNYWSSTPLFMAAIWSPPIKACPVSSAIDIAKTINNEITENNSSEGTETASSIGSIESYASSSFFNNFAALSEDEALKIILARNDFLPPRDDQSRVNTDGRLKNGESHHVKTLKKDVNGEKKEKPHDKDSSIAEIEDLPNDSGINESADDMHEATKPDAACLLAGNSLVGKLGWSTRSEDGGSSKTSSLTSKITNSDASRTPEEAVTYDALIKSYHSGGYRPSPDLNDLLKNYDAPESVLLEKKEEPKCDKKEPELCFEEQIGHLPREKGLDSQNYSCLECSHPVGMTFGKAHLCSYSGNYFCSNCMSTEEFLIPSRIIHNWDLKSYPVSQRAATYLTDCNTLLDMRILNPRIYMAVQTMAQLQTLRIQLNLLRAYLFTCREPVIESLQKEVTSREYLYEHIHKYSVADLLDVPSGSLAQQLQKIIKFARNHVLDCWLCRQKGFICEVCNNPKIIYPFDMDSTYRCNRCNAVFHADCLNSRKPCPKCERKQKRSSRLHLDCLPQDTSTHSAIRSN